MEYRSIGIKKPITPWPRPGPLYEVMERRTWETKEVIACSSHVAPPDPAPVSGRGGQANTPPLQSSKKGGVKQGLLSPLLGGIRQNQVPRAWILYC